jgi:hypothetical protein
MQCAHHQSRVGANAIKQGRVKIGKAQETLGGGAGVRPWCERRVQGCGQRFLVARRRIGAFAMAIGPRGGRSRLTVPARGVLPARG